MGVFDSYNLLGFCTGGQTLWSLEKIIHWKKKNWNFCVVNMCIVCIYPQLKSQKFEYLSTMKWEMMRNASFIVYKG